MHNQAGETQTGSGPAPAVVSAPGGTPSSGATSAPSIPPPRFLQIEPVGQCNLRCQMCPIQFRRDGPPHGPPAFLPYEEFCRLVDDAAGVAELHLQGLGEPLMHPRFFDLVAYAVAKGMRVTTNSNLTLMTSLLAERCIHSGLHYLHVSLDGATAPTYERIRSGASFRRVAHNMEQLLAARIRLGTATPAVGLVMVVMRQNLHELPDLVRLARRWGLDEVFVQHLCHEYGEATLPAQYRSMKEFVETETLVAEDAGRVGRYFAEALDVAKALNVRLRLPRVRRTPYPPGTSGRQRCDWPWRGMYLSYQSLAMPCCMIGTPDRFSFGSAAGKTTTSLWYSPEYETFRRQLESDEPPEICRSCSLYKGTF